MNADTTARMEQTCCPGRIQISKETAENLVDREKENWIEKRADIVEAKGKGKIETWWLVYMENGGSKEENVAQAKRSESFQGTAKHVCPDADPKIRRLISWNVECLLRLLKEVVARRNTGSPSSGHFPGVFPEPSEDKLKKGDTFLDEIKDIIALPRFDDNLIRDPQENNDVVIPEEAVQELTDYVTVIASMYRDNPFHSFEHAR